MIDLPQEARRYIEAMTKFGQISRCATAESPSDLELLRDMAAEIERLRARPSLFYVIERFENGRSCGYWDGGSSRSFAPDIEAAVQFCRHKDAFWATRGWHWNDTQIVEHMRIDGPQHSHEQRLGTDSTK